MMAVTLQKGKGRERTLTAVRSPFRQADEPTVPLLIAGGRASGTPSGFPDGRRFMALGEQLLLGRGVPAASGEAPTDSWPLDDALVSGRHARLRRTPEGVWLED